MDIKELRKKAFPLSCFNKSARKVVYLKDAEQALWDLQDEFIEKIKLKDKIKNHGN